MDCDRRFFYAADDLFIDRTQTSLVLPATLFAFCSRSISEVADKPFFQKLAEI